MDFKPTELKEICSLYLKEYPDFPSKKYKDMMGILTKKQDVPWNLILREEEYQKEHSTYEKRIDDITNDIDLFYWNEVYKKTSGVFQFLKPAKINKEIYKKYLLSENSNVLKSFEPNEDGFANIPAYSLSSSRTGRMIIEEGPQILTLEKSHRNILQSRFGENGSLWYLDFVSLEPRLMLLCSSKDNTHNPPYTGHPPSLCNLNEELPSDIYTFAIKKLKLSGVIDRKLMKMIILRQCYGTSKSTIIKLLEEHEIHKPEEIYEIIDDFFGVSVIKNMIFNAPQKPLENYITNWYGRRVALDSSSPYAALNYFIQSTAVDVAMMGFLNILTAISKIKNANSFIVPLYFLHDALILDVHNNLSHVLPKLCEIGSKNILTFENQKFYIGHEKLEKTYKNNEV